MNARQKLIIIEDRAIVRAGLRMLLGAEPNLEVVGESGNMGDVLPMVAQLAPQLVILDIGGDNAAGLATVAELRREHPLTRILVLTELHSDNHMRAALQAGAHGFVLKHTSDTELLMAVRSVLSGKVFLSPDVLDKVVSVYLDANPIDGGAPKTHWESLTSREREILKLIAEGHTSRYIAGQLSLSIKTVEKHRYNLMKKLDLHNVSALTTFAIGRGLVAAR
jgi:DNA-binding NarL/FixJ family response regulator